MIRTLFVRAMLVSVFATFAGAALANDEHVEFSFADATTPLPPGVNAGEVLTISTSRRGEVIEGVVLLNDGRTIEFVSVASRPLAQLDVSGPTVASASR